jgi:5-methylthioadenosine/S-adenosylhomocysteine deaminase
MPTRYSARWVLPVCVDPIEHGAVLVDGAGRIVAVGTGETVPRPEAGDEVDLGEAVLLPGLVNVHAHPDLTAFRGLLEDLPFHAWIPALMRGKRNAGLGEEDYLTSARWGCVEAIHAGITTTAATEDSGASFEVLRELGLRGVIYREVFGPADEQADDAMAQLRVKVARTRERETDLVRVGISPHAPYTVSDRLFAQAATFAREDGLPVAVHAAESEAEDLLVSRGLGPFAEGLRRRGIATPARAPSTIALLDRLGVLATKPLLIHCVRVSAQDIRLVAESGASVAHCPAANARLGHGTAPVIELREAGIAVGLGSDSVAANNRTDLLEEARLAQLLQRARLQSPTALPSAELLRMATLDGARALGLDARIGSLEPGKDADLCAVTLDAPHTRPAYDPLAALFHAARGPDVIFVAVRGRVLLHREAGITPATSAGLSRLEAIARRLRSAIRQEAPLVAASAGDGSG